MVAVWGIESYRVALGGRGLLKGTTDLALSCPGSQGVPTWECSLLSTPAHSRTLRASRASSREGPPAPGWWCQHLSRKVSEAEPRGFKQWDRLRPGLCFSLIPDASTGVSLLGHSLGSQALSGGLGVPLGLISQRVLVSRCQSLWALMMPLTFTSSSVTTASPPGQPCPSWEAQQGVSSQPSQELGPSRAGFSRRDLFRGEEHRQGGQAGDGLGGP